MFSIHLQKLPVLFSCLILLLPLQGSAQTLSRGLTLSDYSGQSQVKLSLPMIPNGDEFIMAPILGARLGRGSWSLGLQLPLAFILSEEDADEFIMGNPTVDVELHDCTTGDWRLCYGGRLSAGAGLFDLGDDVDSGFDGMQGPEPSSDAYPIYQRVVVRPSGMIGVEHRKFFAHLELGPSFWIPWYSTDDEGLDTKLLLHGQLALGFHISDLITPVMELRGVLPVTEDDMDPWLWFNAGVRLHMDRFEPSLRVSLPLTDYADGQRDDSPLHVEIAASYLF